MSATVAWQPAGLLSGRASNPYAVLILNQPVNKNAFAAVIGGSSLLVCADAGADRLRRLESVGINGTVNKYLPDAIVGDLDSISSDTAAYYEGKGVKVVKDPDQYSTDFTKCLKWLRQEWTKRKQDSNSILDVVVLGGLGGRVDQGFSQIHHLYLASSDKELLRGRIYLLSEQSLTFVLADAMNTISIEPGYFEENIGIIPVLGLSRLTTKGLEWDVEDWPTEFGGQVSTSNHIRASTLEVTFSGPRPLMTLELAPHLTASHPR